jgi:glycosyltransferase involved in cell wall biosynthesis
VPDGVDFTNTVINRKKLKKLKDELSIEDQQFVLLFLGYLYEFAGLKEIIDYYSPKVKNRELNLKFLILGDGGIYSELKKHIEKIKTDWVKLLGRVPFSEITEYIELADLCLMSFSINDITKEVLPIKIIEYMAMKKPVLSTALPGVVLELGNQGGIIFAEDQKKLIRKIEELSQSKKDFKLIGEQGYKLVKEKYDWNQITKDFKALMFNVIKNKLDDDF